MSNLPNPDIYNEATGARKLHQTSEPLPPPIGYPESLSDNIPSQDRPGGDIPAQERPLGVRPAKQGGVALGGCEDEDLPMGKATTGDKIIGKTEKVAGKMTKNPEMHERGELREAGGKGAATGHARAPHD